MWNILWWYVYLLFSVRRLSQSVQSEIGNSFVLCVLFLEQTCIISIIDVPLLLYWPGRPDRHPVGSFLEYLRNAPTGCRSNGWPCELNISSIVGIPIIAHFLCGRPVVATDGSRPSKDATGQRRDWWYGSTAPHCNSRNRTATRCT